MRVLLTRVFARRMERSDLHHFRSPSNFRPIFISDIFLNIDSVGIQRISPVLFATGNPVMFECLTIKIVGLKTAPLQPCEPLPPQYMDMFWRRSHARSEQGRICHLTYTRCT